MEALHNVESHDLDDQQLSTKLKDLEISSPVEIENSPTRQITVRTDSGVASPNNNTSTPPVEAGENSVEHDASDECDSVMSPNHLDEITTPTNTLSDSGQGSEADEGIIYGYHFSIPNYICGKLIGLGGSTIKSLKAESKCNIKLNGKNKHRGRHHHQDPHGLQMCIIEGTRSAIDKCVELIREKFPLDQYPELTLEQINPPDEQASLGFLSPYHSLMKGSSHNVIVSSIYTPSLLSVQLQDHSSYPLLGSLCKSMNETYFAISTPAIEDDKYTPGLVCAALSDNIWVRAEVMELIDEDYCNLKCLDYGYYITCARSDLRKIRSDFLALPVQAVDCSLANVIPMNGLDSWSEEANAVLQELLFNKVVNVRKVGYHEESGYPLVQLYLRDYDPNTYQAIGTEADAILLNKELVERGVACWNDSFSSGESF